MRALTYHGAKDVRMAGSRRCMEKVPPAKRGQRRNHLDGWPSKLPDPVAHK